MRLSNLQLTVDDLRAGDRRVSRTLVNRQPQIASSQAAFTMIEIAIALAVIAFALVAIIGVLPTGITAQKDNREDTIINQDGPYWLESIRLGARGLDQLTNNVSSIGVVVTSDPTFQNLSSVSTNADQYSDYVMSGKTNGGGIIVGLLSLRRGDIYSYNGSPDRYVIRVDLRTRALTGAAVDQGTNTQDLVFSYLLVSEVSPFQPLPVTVDSTNFNDPTLSATNQVEKDRRFAYWREVTTRAANAAEVELTFRWPLLPNDRVGPNRQIFRSLVVGEYVLDTNFALPFFTPQSFAPTTP